MTASAINRMGQYMHHGTHTALITGAAGGIGRETAIEFARRGYRLALCDVDADAVESVAAEIRALGAEAKAWHCDVGKSTDVRKLIDAAVAAFGRIDVAFNNAGVGGSRQPLIDADEDEFDACVQTNLKGTWLCMKYEMQHMLAAGGGVIVNNCSTAGMNGSVGAAYCATKHGIAGLTRSAALVYAAQGIRINAVCPGVIEAGLGKKLIDRYAAETAKLYDCIPAGRAGSAREVAKAVLWLASEDSSFVHGHLLSVDGGYDAR